MKNIKISEKLTHLPADEERNLLELLYLVSQHEDVLELIDSYQPKTSALVVVPTQASTVEAIEDQHHQPITQQDVLEILHHLAAQEEDLEAADLYCPEPIVAATLQSQQTVLSSPSIALTPEVEPELHSSILQQDGLEMLHHLAAQEEEEDIDRHCLSVSNPSPVMQTQAARTRPAKTALAQLGFPSLLIAASGAGSWLLLSPSHSIANQQGSQNTVSVDAGRQSQINSPIATARPSAPEMLPSEKRFSATPSTSKVAPIASQTSRPQIVKAAAPVTTKAAAPVTTKAASSITTQKWLKPEDLADLSGQELTLLRNEIYARHGRQFTEPELQQYFEKQSWYQPKYLSHQFSTSSLSRTDMHNAILIRDYQQTHKLW